MAIHKVTLKANEVLTNHATVQITIDGYRSAVLRLWLGCQVLKIARLIMGVPFDVKMAQRNEVPTSAQAVPQDRQDKAQ